MENPLRILLIRPFSERSAYASTPPLGLGYIAASLRKGGFDPEIWDLDLGRGKIRAFKEMIARDPPADIIGIQAYTRDADPARRFLAWLAPSLPEKTVVVLGGPHATIGTDQALTYFERADFAIVGEGERPTATMARQLADRGEIDRTGVSGLAWLQNGKVERNPQVVIG